MATKTIFIIMLAIVLYVLFLEVSKHRAKQKTIQTKKLRFTPDTLDEYNRGYNAGSNGIAKPRNASKYYKLGYEASTKVN